MNTYRKYADNTFKYQKHDWEDIVMNYAEESLKMHYDLKGKIEIVSRAPVDSKEALSLAYTP